MTGRAWRTVRLEVCDERHQPRGGDEAEPRASSTDEIFLAVNVVVGVFPAGAFSGVCRVAERQASEVGAVAGDERRVRLRSRTANATTATA